MSFHDGPFKLLWFICLGQESTIQKKRECTKSEQDNNNDKKVVNSERQQKHYIYTLYTALPAAAPDDRTTEPRTGEPWKSFVHIVLLIIVFLSVFWSQLCAVEPKTFTLILNEQPLSILNLSLIEYHTKLQAFFFAPVHLSCKLMGQYQCSLLSLFLLSKM